LSTSARLSTLVLLFLASSGPLFSGSDADSAKPVYYQPKLRPGRTLERFLPYVPTSKEGDADMIRVAGSLLSVDFPEEAEADKLAVGLGQLSALLRQGPAHVPEALSLLLAPEFKGGPLTFSDAAPLASGALEVWRSKAAAGAPVLDRAAFGVEMAALLSDFETIQTAEFLITRIELTGDKPRLARTDVRYDLVGSSRKAWRAQRVGYWHLTWRQGTDGTWRVGEWTTKDQVRSKAAAPVFSDVTETALGANPSSRYQLQAGFDDWLARVDSAFTRDSMAHHGVAVGDVDGDGLDDIFVAQPEGFPKRLFRNKGDGTFEDITEAAGLMVLDGVSQGLFLDVDNDGDQDLIMVTGSGLLLFMNDGKGHFTFAPDAFNLKNLKGISMSIAAADYDRDGFVDLYVCAYSYFIGAGEDKGAPTPYHDAQNGPPSLLLHNDGHGHFVDVTSEIGLENNNRYHFAAAWADYDEDGWPDLAVANDFGRKNLYHNEGMKDGKVTFKDVAAAAGVEDYGAGMSATFVDYDNDGHLDLYFGNMWSAPGQRIMYSPSLLPDAPSEMREIYRRHVRGNSLFRNRGDGTFEDVTLKTGAEFGRWAWSSDALDFDNDGWEDLYIVNGMFTRAAYEENLDSFFWRQVVAKSPLTKITGTPYEDAWRAINRLLADHSQANHQRNVFLRNDGQGAFEDVSGTVGLDLDQDGRSFAVTDFDGDGDPDLIVMAARSAPQLRIFRNDFAQKNASLALRLSGTKSNRDAIGARVTVDTDRMHRTKIVQANSGFISQHSKELLFGLGQSERVTRVTVTWPSGDTQVLTDVPINQRAWIEEGNSAITRAEAFRAKSVPPNAPAPALPASPLPTETWLYDPFPAPDFKLPDLYGGPALSLSALRGQPAVLLLWAASAPASRPALQALSRERATLAAAGVGVLTVALDGADAASVRAAVQGVVGVPIAVGDQETGNKYAILNHHLFVAKEELHLPTMFLLNAQGEIVKVYRDRITTLASLMADVPKIVTTQADRLARALPFPGKMYQPVGGRLYLQYAVELVEQGYESAALPAFEHAVREDSSAFTLFNLGTLYVKSGQPERARIAFQRALSVNPELAEASNGLGALVAQSGNLAAAIGLFRKALAVTPDYPEALNNLGYSLVQTGQDGEAFELYQKAVALQPDFPEAFNNLGIYFARRGEMAKAESYFKRAVEKRPEYGEAANNLALVLMTHDAAVEAEGVLKRALEANPDFEACYVTLVNIYLATGRAREGTQLLQQLLQKNPKNAAGLQIMDELRRGR
jgi:Tfp pilus assembly protein PilF/peroxiredoxin